MTKFLKKLLFMLILLLSPMTMLALFGVIYIVVKILGGLELTTAFSSFKSALYTLIPYFPYLTIIPGVLFMLAYLIKNKIKVKK